MSTSSTELPEAAAAAIAEASRIAAEAARQSEVAMKASIEAASTSMEDSNKPGRELLGAWSTQSEVAMKAAYDAQNAAIEAGMGMFETGVKSDRGTAKLFTELVRKTQQASLDSWHAAMSATVKAAESTK